MTYYIIASILFGFVLGFVIALISKRNKTPKYRNITEEEAQLIENAKKRASSLLKESEIEAKSRLLEMKSSFDIEIKETREELKNEERRLSKKSEKLDRQDDELSKQASDIRKKERETQDNLNIAVKEKEKHIKLSEQTKQTLETISNFTQKEAKEHLLKIMESDARREGAKLVKKITSEAKQNADKNAKKIIATTIQRYAGEYVVERTVSVVNLPGDEMKGRIIGREGRNIRALEAATGIDLIIDDTPEAVILSGFNPVRREVARLSLEKLILDGRIHPARIEDIVERATQEVDVVVKEAGEQAIFDLDIHGLDPELIKIVGQLKFRTSYAQNILHHSIEVAFLAGIIAAELGLDVKLAKRMGLLHDIGKAIDHEVEGPHAVIGSKLAKKYNEKPNVVHAIASHHEDLMPESIYDYIIQASDALSGARPGARKETLENYVKRLEDLENIANSFEGVVNTYAIQAGREIRVITESSKVTDDEAVFLARDIADKIEENLNFPGQVKVVVIRETRAIEHTNK